MKWKDLDFKQRAELIKLGVQSGIKDINQIRQLYDEQQNTVSDVLYQNNKVNQEQQSTGVYNKENNYKTPQDSLNELNYIIEGIQQEINIEQINAEQPEQFKRDRLGVRINERPVPAMMDSSRVREDLSQRYDGIRKRVQSYKKYRAYGGYTDDPPFLQRILNNDNRNVVDWENNKQKATHKLSYAETPEGYIVYPEVQEVNGELHDFTDPKYNHGKWDALDNAIKNNDTLRFSNEQDALRYTQEYKQKYPEYFKQFDKGGYLSNTSIGNKVKKYKDGGPLKKKKENSLEYRQALFNNIDPREGYPSPITAIKYYQNVVNKMKEGDTSKNWKTDGSIGDATAEAAWARYLKLPYDTTLFPTWNGDTVRLTKELENQIPIDTNFIKQDIENIKMHRDYDRSMGIFDREDAYRMALNTRRLALDNLRKTYKTGEWVQMNEFMFNDLNPFDYYNQGSDYKTPLNVLQNFGLRYDKNTNSIIYGDKYDLNNYDYFLPGNPFIIRGSIPLEQKYNGGYILPKEVFSHKF